MLDDLVKRVAALECGDREQLAERAGTHWLLKDLLTQVGDVAQQLTDLSAVEGDIIMKGKDDGEGHHDSRADLNADPGTELYDWQQKWEPVLERFATSEQKVSEIAMQLESISRQVSQSLDLGGSVTVGANRLSSQLSQSFDFGASATVAANRLDDNKLPMQKTISGRESIGRRQDCASAPVLVVTASGSPQGTSASDLSRRSSPKHVQAHSLVDPMVEHGSSCRFGASPPSMRGSMPPVIPRQLSPSSHARPPPPYVNLGCSQAQIGCRSPLSQPRRSGTCDPLPTRICFDASPCAVSTLDRSF